MEPNQAPDPVDAALCLARRTAEACSTIDMPTPNVVSKTYATKYLQSFYNTYRGLVALL